MKKLNVNENCVGCGACVASYSDYFTFNDQGLSEAIPQTVETSEEELNEMASICPFGAIEVIDEETSN